MDDVMRQALAVVFEAAGIDAERRHQIEQGYDAQHDDTEEANGRLVDAAYMLLFEHTQGPGCVDDDDDPDDWPQALALKLRHADPLKRLVVAAALIAAEIDRLSRARISRTS